MFGHDDKKDENDNAQPMSTQPVSHGLLGIDEDNDTAASAAPVSEPSSSPLPEPTQPTPGFGSDPVTVSPSNDNEKPAEPPTLSPVNDVTTPPEPVSIPQPVTTPPEPSVSPSLSGSETVSSDLTDIKRQALQELSPLIDHLDQNAEEKFKTSMMMIQASDDKDLIPQAFKAAKEITDEKRRAQALLDIVNEINYFTHKSDD